MYISFIFAAAVFLGGAVASATSDTMRIGGVFATLTAQNKKNMPGIQKKAAFLMAINELRKKSGFPINITIANTKETFTDGVYSAIKIVNSFGGKGVNGTIGSSISIINNGLAAIFKESNTPQIAFGEFEPLLSHTEYPIFLSTFRNSASQGEAIARILCDYYGYSRFVVVYTTDLYGLDNYNEFYYTIVNRGISPDAAIIEIKLIPGDTDFLTTVESYIDNALIYKPRIFVLLLQDYSIAANFIIDAYEKGLLNEWSFVWGTSEITSNDLISAVSREILHKIGYMGLFSIESDWKYTTRGKTFITQFRALPSTLNNTWERDNNGQKLYVHSGIKVGADYSKITFDEIDPHIAYVYDATYTLFYGILNNTLDGNDQTGEDIIRAIIENVKFVGVTGAIDFSERNGMKFRSDGVKFGVSNFNGTEFNRVATYNDKLILCNTSYYLPGGCHKIYYGTPGNVIPRDRPEPRIQSMPYGFRAGSIFMAAFLFSTILFYGGVLVYYRKNKILKVSQAPVSWTILFAAIFAVVRIATNGMHEVTLDTCYTNYFFGHLSFMGVFILFVKSLRVFLIINSKKLRKVRITTGQTMYGILCGFVFFILYLIFSTVIPATFYISHIAETYIDGLVIYHHYCASKHPVANYILWAAEGAVFLATAKITFDTRNIPDAINETKVIAVCVYLILTIVVIGMIFTQVLKFMPYMNDFITGALLFVAYMAFMNVYFGSKFYLLYNGADLDKKFNIIYKNKVRDSDRDILSNIQNKLYVENYDEIRSAFLKKDPKTDLECDVLISILSGIKLKINSKDVLQQNSSTSAGGGLTARGGGDARQPSSIEQSLRAEISITARETPTLHHVEGGGGTSITRKVYVSDNIET